MENNDILLIAHRGDTIAFPENTIEAFRSAFEKGADGIELDVHLYQKRLLVVHDFLFDKHKKHSDLTEVLKLFIQRGRIEIEIKAFSVDILQPLQRILAQYPNANIELTTSEIPLARYIKETFPQFLLGIIFHDFLFEDWMTTELVQDKLIGWGKLSKADVLHVMPQTLDKYGENKLVEKLHAVGFLVHSHIVNTNQRQKILAKFKKWRVDQCTIDNIDLVKAS